MSGGENIYVMGISALYHDVTAALIKDGETDSYRRGQS